MSGKLSISFILSLVALGVGFVNQLLISRYFGTSPELDGYWIAIAIVNFLGFYAHPLRDAIVPSFHEALIDSAKASRYASAAISLSLALGLGGGGLLVLGFAIRQPWFVFAPSYQANHTDTMLLWLVPAVLMIAASEVLGGLLAALNLVIRQAICRLITPIVTCLCLFLFADSLRVYALPASFVAANVFVMMFALLALFKCKIHIRICIPNPAMGLDARKMFGTLVVVYIFAQLHVLLERAVFAQAGPGVVSAFQYAAALVNTLIGLIVGPLISTLWPRFLALSAAGDNVRLSVLLDNLLICLAMPLTIVCIFIFNNADAIVYIVFSRGGFGLESARITATALSFLIFTSVPACLSQVAVRLLNSQRNSRAIGMAGLSMAFSGMTLLVIGGATHNYNLAMTHWFVGNLVSAFICIHLAYQHLDSHYVGLKLNVATIFKPAVFLAVAYLVVPKVILQESKVLLLADLAWEFFLYFGIFMMGLALAYRRNFQLVK